MIRPRITHAIPLLFAALALVVVCHGLCAEEIAVAPGASINAAIASAPAGAKVVLESGRYFEAVVLNKPVTLAARQGGTATIGGGNEKPFRWAGGGKNWSAKPEGGYKRKRPKDAPPRPGRPAQAERERFKKGLLKVPPIRP